MRIQKKEMVDGIAYELKDHLDNVRVMISDAKIFVDADTDYSISIGDQLLPKVLTY